MKTKIVPIVMGALGTVPLRLKGNLKGIGSLHCWISKDTKKSIGNVKVRKEKHFGVPWQLVGARHHDFSSCYKTLS